MSIIPEFYKNKDEDYITVRFLDSLVKTPPKIQDILDSLSEQMDFVSDNIAELCSVNGGKINDVKDDIKNLFEKHISINYSDKNVFKRGKVAYPIRLSATDDEETKVETTAACNEPLQIKAVFLTVRRYFTINKSARDLFDV